MLDGNKKTCSMEKGQLHVKMLWFRGNQSDGNFYCSLFLKTFLRRLS